MRFLMILINLAYCLQYTSRAGEQISLRKNTVRRHSPEEWGIGSAICMISIALYAAVFYGMFVLARRCRQKNQSLPTVKI